MGDARTGRLLHLFHVFYYCETVSFGAIYEYIPKGEVSRKTIFRYIRFLEEAGLIRLRYSKTERAYMPVDDFFVPRDGEFYPAKFPEKKSQRLYMEKIIRLCTLMTEVVMNEEEDPVAWYRKRYPELSDRTRQRDFKQLYEIDYKIIYITKNERDEMIEDGKIDPPRYYYDFREGF